MEFLIPQFKDIIDILIIAFLIYQSLLIIRKSGGYQVLWGLLFLLILYVLASIFELQILTALLSGIRTYWILAIVILFQPELRTILTKLNLAKELKSVFARGEKSSIYTPLIDAVSSMSFRKTGALIVLENKTKLTEYIQKGEQIDANISMRLILTIFNNKTVLHDGAIIIRGNRIMSAKVVLPLSQNSEYSRKFGTRHLAGIGITEVSDSIAIIVSEQTGQVSVAQGGHITVDIAFEELMQIITDASK
ncbi:MAG: diadenylate cyclase CdaA [Candidatus Cloacimonadaceae bacterium]|jgi:diadenylate cyclase|nr:diadenylate cyclase CdaA [Candidatus Cloacimonadota bacterium]MDY0126552.1 diadenylate cyclase CdaA [Candidatus Cloacimonadaceae bacterium]MCB5254640.1 diadenylate cyclase CdaA [Candidatus Cloacimonadota bacterium]MCK9177727.1 diadenylate cyclase CdaA [Candidatus Cloacimonadota bacterium]MCK9241901.1 diadenylate cyclase CdaA [Candidatus Cloacimonadota bacterium]